MKVVRFASREQLTDALAEQLAPSPAPRGRAGVGAVMLSGGHAPRPVYDLLAIQTFPHSANLRVLYSDERYVPAISDASNYHASRPYLKALALPEEHILRVRTELPLEEAATDYESRLQSLLNTNVPIHLGLLGMGADGHTASLFTPADLERARGHLAISVQRPDGMQAVSVTPELLRHVERLLMVVVGAEKRDALAALLRRDPELIAWRVLKGCRNIEVWCENQA